MFYYNISLKPMNTFNGMKVDCTMYSVPACVLSSCAHFVCAHVLVSITQVGKGVGGNLFRLKTRNSN